MPAKKKDPTRGIYQRGNIYWLAQQRKNKRVFVSLETSDFADAVRRAEELRELPELNQGGLLRAEIQRFVDYKVNRGDFSFASGKNVPYFLKALPDMFGDIHPVKITCMDAMRFYTTLRGRLKNEKSAQTYVGHIRSFYNWAVKTARICNTNPFAGLDLPKLVSVARKEFCQPDLRDKLIKECPRDDLRFLLYCGFHAGLRRNEIVEARPCWFDLKARLLSIKKISEKDAVKAGLDPFDLKDREERSIPLSTAFTVFLKKWLNRDGAYCLAPGVRRGVSRYRYDLRRPFDEYMREKGCPWVTMHTLRRTFASIQASKGTSIYLIAKWLGDGVDVVTKHYAHLIPAHDMLEGGL